MRTVKGNQITSGMIIDVNRRKVNVTKTLRYSKTAGIRQGSSCRIGCIHVNDAICIDVEDEVIVYNG